MRNGIFINRVSPNDSYLRSLRFEEITAYLKNSGWIEIESLNKNFMAFEEPVQNGYEPVILVLPVHTNFSDWPQRLGEAISLLADLQDVSPTEVMQAIKRQAWDSCKIRVLNDFTTDNVIPLNIAAVLVDSMQNLLTAAESATLNPQPYFAHLPHEGIEYARECRFSQTFAGSFGFVIESPVAHRPTIERLFRGLHLIGQGASEEVLVESYQDGFNANMLKAFMEMVGKEEPRTIEYSVAWSIQKPPADDLADNPVIRIEADIDLTPLERAARKLEAGYIQIDGYF